MVNTVRKWQNTLYNTVPGRLTWSDMPPLLNPYSDVVRQR